MTNDEIRTELYQTLTRFRRERYLPDLGMDDLTTGEERIILLICSLEDKMDEIRPSYLADVARVSSSALSQVVTSLTSKGLVERKHRSDDFRAVYLVLTPKGRQLAEKGMAQREKYYDALIDYLGMDAAVQTIDTLGKVIEFNELLADEGEASQILNGTPVERLLND